MKTKTRFIRISIPVIFLFVIIVGFSSLLFSTSGFEVTVHNTTKQTIREININLTYSVSKYDSPTQTIPSLAPNQSATLTFPTASADGDFHITAQTETTKIDTHEGYVTGGFRYATITFRQSADNDQVKVDAFGRTTKQ